MKNKSVVWKFFDRIQEDGRCVAVLCKLCDSQYKYFGNTTNLRVHLINKHPIQWELSQSGTLDETTLKLEAASIPSKSIRRKFRRQTADNVGAYSISINDNGDISGGAIPKIEIRRVDSEDSDREDKNTIKLVKQMHGDSHSDEEWLEEDHFNISHIEAFEQKVRPKKIRKLKREVTSPLPTFYVPNTEKIVYEEPKKDEYSVFGEYIANKLRKVHSQRTRGNLQQLITTILWQADYGMYESAEAVKRVLTMSMEPPPTTDLHETIVNEENVSNNVVIMEEVPHERHSTESASVLN